MTREQIEGPAERPCGSCPYRTDHPSGVWAVEEYVKLTRYDLPMGQQPQGLFLCHQRDGRMCAGWIACHGAGNLLALRVAVLRGDIDEATIEACRAYTTPVPVWPSGVVANRHGLRDIRHPREAALDMQRKMLRLPGVRR